MLIVPFTFTIDALTYIYALIGNKLMARTTAPAPASSVLVVSTGQGMMLLQGKVYSETAKSYRTSVSVIVPAYNEEKSIESTVRALFEQTLKPKNVIIVDDCSNDRTADICQALKKEYGEQLIYTRREINSGKANNINYAVEQFKDKLGIVTLINDGDCVTERTALEALTRHFSQEKIAAVTPYGYTTPPKNILSLVLHRGNSWNNRIFKFRKKAQGFRSGISVLCGACTAFRTSVLKEHPIPERTKTEDTDYTWVLQENGYKIVFDEDARAYSRDLEKPTALMRQWYRWYSGTMQNMFVHNWQLLKAKSMLFTTVLPSFIESVPYSFGIATLPIIATINLTVTNDPIPFFNMNYVKGFLLADFLFTAIPTAVIAPRYLLRLPDIYVYKYTASVITVIAYSRTTFERITGQQDKWSNTWKRKYGMREDNLHRISKDYMTANINRFHELESNWTSIGERPWNNDNYFMELPRKWELSFTIGDEKLFDGYIIGSQVNENRAKVNKILLDKDSRRKGFGRKLLRRFENECRIRGVQQVELKAMVDNNAANNFYESLGYRSIDSAIGTDGRLRVVYEKSLA